MKKYRRFAFALLPLLVAAFISTSRGGNFGNDKKEPGKIVWKTFDQGIELAMKENKLLVIDFYTDWCHWCKVMDKDTYGSKQVIEYAKDKVIMAKINAETDEKFKFRDAYYSGRELSMMFGVRGFPTTAFMNGKGELITSISGFIPADRFAMILKYLSGNWYEKMTFEEFLKKETEEDKG